MSKARMKAKDKIIGFFNEQNQAVYRWRELASILSSKRNIWDLQDEIGPKRFIDFLVSDGRLQAITLNSRKYGKEKRFLWGDASPYEIALSLRPGAYLSHGTAMFLHGLTQQIPKRIYVNKEQSIKHRPAAEFSQDRLRFAFSRKQRESQYVFEWDTCMAVLLNGKNTNRLGVGKIKSPDGQLLEATKLERTLIDIVVRPAYAGGIFEVAEVFGNARKRVSIDLLIDTLVKLDYLYPYHQSIGFLMELSGYGEICTRHLRNLGLDFDFYLQHGLKDPDYNPNWRLFIPKGF